MSIHSASAADASMLIRAISELQIRLASGERASAQTGLAIGEHGEIGAPAKNDGRCRRTFVLDGRGLGGRWHYMMLRRNHLYTAITRGKRLVVLVGSKRALARRDGVRNARWSGLQ